MVAILLSSFILGNLDAFVLPSALHHPIQKSSTTCLQAKKKKGKQGGKGFGKEPPANVETAATATTTSAANTPSPMPMAGGLSSVEGGSNDIPAVDESIPIDERTAAILRDNYGLRTQEEQQEAYKREQAAKEQKQKLEEWKKLADDGKEFDIMEVLPGPVLLAIDRFLKVGLAVCTVLFVLAGVGITIEAWSKASEQPLPQDIDSFIVNVIEPNFTPGLGVLLGFSVSLGAFAAAQLSSSSSTYRADK